MEATPNQIYFEFKNKKLEKTAALNQLIALVSNSEDVSIRIASLDIIEKIGSTDDKIFNLLENLLVSDDNEKIRNLAIKVIKNNFIEKAFKLMKWAYQHESSVFCLISILSTLGKINDYRSKSFLIDKIEKIDIYQFNKSLDNLIKNKDIQNLTNEKLSEIIINYIIIKQFKERIAEIDYQVENGVVTALDLSGISNTLSGWNILRDLPEYIELLKYLRKLDLKINNIAKISKVIGTLSFLTYLDLSNNNLKNIPLSMGSLNSLEYLFLKYNKLTDIPKSIGNLHKLKILDLRHNRITTLPDELNNLSLLEILDLHGNRLKKLPKSLQGLKSLKKLELGLNNLQIIPEWIKHLNSLKTLGLGGNKFLNEFTSLSFSNSLTELNLYDNNLKELPEELGSLKSLKTLILRNNNLSYLPESFKNLKSLKKLDISWNNLTTLPDWISSLSSLEELNLWGNYLKSLPPSIGNLSSLKILNLNFNNFIRKIPNSLKDLEKKGLKIYK